MNSELKFRIYNKLLKKCFKVTRIDYIEKCVYYINKDTEDEDIVSFEDCILLMPTGIYDSNRHEIFEGDIISYQENSFTYKKLAEIIYENGCFVARQILPKNVEIKAEKENLYLDDFKDLLCMATLSINKPIRIVGNKFTYKPSRNSSKIKITI